MFPMLDRALVTALSLLVLAFAFGCGSESSEQECQCPDASGGVCPDVGSGNGGGPDVVAVDVAVEDTGLDISGPEDVAQADVSDPFGMCTEPPGGFGCPCAENNDCGSGLCVPWDEGFVCTETCVANCPEGWTCRGVSLSGPDVLFVCWPGQSHLCQPCADDSQCGEGRCVELDDGRRCARPCADDRPCPDGYTCTDDGEDGGAQCLPVTNACDCGPWPGGEAREEPCLQENEHGSCWGTQVCDPEGGWGDCDAAVPSAEICNGLDDDCNGRVDDLPGRGNPCALEGEAGSCPGVLGCGPDGDALVCLGRAPTFETCDGVDEDCDGETDEGLVGPECPLQTGVCEGARARCGGSLGWLDCTAADYPGYAPYEHLCDGRDEDCDGVTDDVDADGDGHISAAAGCDGDDCDDGNPLVHADAPELCGDGLDNDCDGIPENLDADGDGHIAAACGGDDCNDASAEARPGLEEICGDGLDNDCDGSVDNRDEDGDGFLTPDCGGSDCDDTLLDVYPGAPEQCNDRDDDCNGVTDDKDLDGDGHIDADPLCGGSDCDDTRMDVNPDQRERCGDDIDEDCSGAIDDRDLDGDGQIDAGGACGGDDCDDLDEDVRLGAPELFDTLDNDCDGVVDEGFVREGDVVISELMVAPQAVTAAAGAYVELTNTTELPINVVSWQVQAADGSPLFTVAADGPLITTPQRPVVICANEEPEENGGVECDAVDPDLDLTGGALAVSLEGVRIDRVAFADWQGFQAGRSLTLDPAAFSAAANDLPGNWCAALDTDPLDGGDYGTPGVRNPSCSGPPALDGIDPAEGSNVGGETVFLTGSGFTGAQDVRLDDIPCSDWEVIADDSIRCVVPFHVTGDVDVTVHKEGDVATQSDAFRYTGIAVRHITWTSTFWWQDGDDPPWPDTTASAGSQSRDLHGQVRWAGVTGDEGAHDREIVGHIGYGPQFTDPRFDPGWRWVPAEFWRPFFDNDEYRAWLTIAEPGVYSYCFRFSDNGGYDFMYGDVEPGTADGFTVERMATITVVP